MNFEHFLREANTKPDYNTNSGSYYKDLARKQELIKLLAKKIWEYEKILDDTLDNISLRLESYINENDSLMTERLKNWDERIENLDEEVSHIFIDWLNDGTLEQIINHDVLGNKADKDYVDNLHENVKVQVENNTDLVRQNVALIDSKVSQNYVDTLFASLIDGSPKELYYSLNALISAYPNGNVGTYLVFDTTYTDGAHLFMYKQGWQDLGVYTGFKLTESELKRVATERYSASRIADKSLNLFQNGLLLDDLAHFTPNNVDTTLSIVSEDNAKWLRVSGKTGVLGNGVYQIFREYDLLDNRAVNFNFECKNFNNNDVLVVQLVYVYGSDDAPVLDFKNFRFKFPDDGSTQKINFTTPIVSPFELHYDRIKVSFFYETASGVMPTFFIRELKATLVDNVQASFPYNMLDDFRLYLDQDVPVAVHYGDNFIRPINNGVNRSVGCLIPNTLFQTSDLDNHRIKIKGSFMTSDLGVVGTFGIRGLNAARQEVTLIRAFTVKNIVPNVKQSFEFINYPYRSMLEEQGVTELQVYFSYDDDNVTRYIDIFELEIDLVKEDNVFATSDTNTDCLPQLHTHNVPFAYQKTIGKQPALTFDVSTEVPLGRQGFLTQRITSAIFTPDMLENSTIFECTVQSEQDLFVDVILSIQKNDDSFFEVNLANSFLRSGTKKKLYGTYNLNELVRRIGGWFKNISVLIVNSSQVGNEQKSFNILNWNWFVENERDVIPLGFKGDVLDSLPTLNLIGDTTGIGKDSEVVMKMVYNSESLTLNAFAKLEYQGSSSMAYDKKNFKIKMYEEITCDTKMPVQMKKTWEAENKYNLKANWIDVSHAKNIVASRLTKEMYQSNPSVPDNMLKTSAVGQIDGFPINLFINNEYHGIHTFNLGDKPKMVGTNDESVHALVSGELQTPGAWFQVNESELDGTVDWAMEFPDDPTVPIKTAFNRFLSFVNTSTDEEFKANLGSYVNKNMLYDYLIGVACMTLADQYGKNQMYATFDMNIWTPVLYDMDTSFGTTWNGADVIPYDVPLLDFKFFKDNKLQNRTYLLMKTELRERYEELRKTVFTQTNMISKFEQFIDSVGVENYTYDSLRWIDIPSRNITSMRKIREHIIKRLNFLDDNFAK